MPVSKLDFIFGYAFAFFLVAALQACVTCFVVLGLLGVTVLGGTLATLRRAVAAALLGTVLGLFSSACSYGIPSGPVHAGYHVPAAAGLRSAVPRDQMATALQWFADVMPLTYSVDAMQQVTMHAAWTATHTKDLIIVLSFPRSGVGPRFDHYPPPRTSLNFFRAYIIGVSAQTR